MRRSPGPQVGAGYPPSPVLELALSELSQGQGWTTQAALATRRTASARRALPCCLVQEAPKTRSDASFYYGIESAGYPIASERGGGVPIRIARWLLRCKPGDVARHTCDQPRCVALAHLEIGDQGDNLADAIRRQRRRRPRSPCAPPPNTRHTGPPLGHIQTTESRGEQTSSRWQQQDTVFCLAGFHSPSKRARAERAAALDQPPAAPEFSVVAL